ncbi:MAG TPA: hypothetical protein VHM30_14660 [Gemmatimonadaceae bacterium]|nr:hypothetical protein [Gemmatimonadaceae bacterium]
MRTRCLSALCLSILVAACMRGEARRDSSAGAVDTARTATAGDAGAALLRSVAGKWNMVARPTAGRDSTPTRVTLNATGDTAGWTMVLGGQTVALHVRVSGDTIITSSDPYSSVRREGVTVRTVSSHRLDGDRLVGTTVAHYMVKGADSVLVLNTTATRAP